MKGYIALDIDGTITDNPHKIPQQVVDFLKGLVEQGWKIVFVTGRTFAFAHSALHSLPFPYLLAIQNGADLLQMPEKKLITRHYLTAQAIGWIEEAHKNVPGDFLIYSGYEKGDFCYYRPARIPPRYIPYLEKIQKLSPEPWKALSTYSFDPAQGFPLMKCFGTQEEMLSLQFPPTLTTSVIHDPLAPSVYITLITAPGASKGAIVRHLKAESLLPVIAAGDDHNDIPMLQAADIAIVMSTAPPAMHPLADILAKPASEQGIIAALCQALRL